MSRESSGDYGEAGPPAGRAGMTLMEVMIVATLIVILATGFLASLNIKSQFAKGRDARRKTDLLLLKTKLEDYYNDNEAYPDPAELTCKADFSPYLTSVPCEPGEKDSYLYVSTGQSYQIYTTLEYKADPAIGDVGCTDGCGPDNAYNYGVASPNIGL